ncbi:hypothetical protein AVEN_102094-1, partial [Araneus ventricosus]
MNSFKWEAQPDKRLLAWLAISRTCPHEEFSWQS